MQLLADVSYEHGERSGLGWCGGRVEKLKARGSDIRVPHVGWNTVRFSQQFGQFGAGDESTFYFDHSYSYREPTLADSVGTCNHGLEFCAVLRRENIIATQFHPEKSQSAGMRFLRSFLDMGPGA
jgi:glutamine amidotransferase